ncbi:hypothetical protein KIN20_031195 [Parelaphostrongylus tenuis]|uniref:Abnormal cell migration protein 18-like fibronectin type I domain-containing protein n=1 Tax=Parelaphostrongylus tenuis TaxID=148309 RepID=A0AAD5WGP0_PARTN|nr:hypothetical protein KIN20_031195 [Parelaphostrongylus tenuis]
MNYLYICLFLTGALACQYKGTTYKNGDEWTENENVTMRCKIDPNGSYRTEVSACVAPGGTVVPVNGERQVGDNVWECRMSGNGQVMLRRRLSERASCNGHPYGSEWVQVPNKYRCGEGGTQVFIGCVTLSGDFVPDGEKRLVNGSDVECKKHSNGIITMEVIPRSSRYGSMQSVGGRS